MHCTFCAASCYLRSVKHGDNAIAIVRLSRCVLGVGCEHGGWWLIGDGWNKEVEGFCIHRACQQAELAMHHSSEWRTMGIMLCIDCCGNVER